MSAASRRNRQTRGILARYLHPALLEQMLQIAPDETQRWAAGDHRIGPHHAHDIAYRCFEHAARTVGLNDAHEWFTTDNLSLNGAQPANIIAARATEVLAAARADSPFPHTPLEALDVAGNPRVAVAGDWHGNLAYALGSIERLASAGIRALLHLGDFSLWPGPAGARYIRRVTKACDEHDITIYVTDGNHEDHDRLALIEPVDGVRWITDRIGYHRRGRRWEWAGTTFVSLGGAPSVNRNDLTEGRSWWAGEQITHHDAATAISMGSVDVMLTHDAPEPSTRAVEGIIRHNPQGWPTESLAYAAEGRALLTSAFHALQPRLLAHGHHHVVDRAIVTVPGATRDTEVISLGSDGTVGNLAILDIETLDVTVI